MNNVMRDFASNFLVGVGTTGKIVRQSDNTPMLSILTKNGSECNSFELVFGTIVSGVCTFTVLLEESADNITYTTVATKNMSGTLTGLTFASQNTVNLFNYYGPKKYARLTVTPAANATNLDWCVLTVQGNNRTQP